MSVVALRDFSSYYNELKAWQPTHEDLLKNICREERSERKVIIEREWCEFQDMLHIRGVWMTEKKLAEKGRLPRLEPRAIAVWKQEREIWFPAQPPRVVAPPTNHLVRCYPFAKAKALFKEETHMREWLAGVEHQRRERIEGLSATSLHHLTCFDDLHRKEQRNRVRIQKDEFAIFTSIRKSVFIKAPPDYFRQKVIERYGRSEQKPKAIADAPHSLPPVSPLPPPSERHPAASPHKLLETPQRDGVLPSLPVATTRQLPRMKDPAPSEPTASTARPAAPVTWKSLPPLSGRSAPSAAQP